MATKIELEKKPRQIRVGVVTSDRMTKTIVVEVERKYRHPEYKKVVSTTKKFYAHDEAETANTGDLVRIEETRPLSKLKRWRLIEVVKSDKHQNAARL